MHLRSLVFLTVIGVALSAADKPKKWALIVAGSNGWGNYRHQADVCHAYHVLNGHGIPEENIVVMMYDDIAHSSLNPYKGEIYNKPHGQDVYAGVPKDYTGEDVTPENFLKILQGLDMTVGSRKTIKAGPDDHVFVFFSDHGATGLVAFPNEELHVKQLNDALMNMHMYKQYGKLVFYLEACESGSMFRHVLQQDIGIYALTASDYDESSWGTYCDNDMGLPCMGDLFSVNWMQDSDVEDLTVETLKKQADIVRTMTNKSRVMQYGELDYLNDHVSEYQGDKDCDDECNKTREWPTGSVNSREIHLWHLHRQLHRAKPGRQQERVLKQLSWMQQKRDYADRVISEIVSKTLPPTPLVDLVMTVYPPALTRLDCHYKVTRHYSKHCFSFARNEYVMRHSRILANLCEAGVDTGDLLDVIYDVCNQLVHKPVNIM